MGITPVSASSLACLQPYMSAAHAALVVSSLVLGMSWVPVFVGFPGSCCLHVASMLDDWCADLFSKCKMSLEA